MRQPPPIRQANDFPIVTGTIVLAIGITLAWWGKLIDIGPLFENVNIRRGELWRIVTSVFPHGGIMHLMFNVYWTWAFGTLIEEKIGHLKTLGIFLLLAVIANGSEYVFLYGGIGLSGIGYGLFGLLWVLSKRDSRFQSAVDDKTTTLFVVWFFICIVTTVAGIFPVANIAHGMGACAGALLGWAMTCPPRLRFAACASVVCLFLATLTGATVLRPWINLSPHRGDEEARIGYDALMAGENNSAVSWLHDATIARPMTAENWYNLGIAYDRVSQHDLAKEAYDRAAKLEPETFSNRTPSR